MVAGLRNEKLKGRNFALTIILGIFIAIMVSVLFNLVVSYVYPGPEFNVMCKGMETEPATKYIPDKCLNCTFSKPLQERLDNCTMSGGIVVPEYNENGCTIEMKECNMCQKNFEEAMKKYNRQTFFVFAAIGFILIITGLYVAPLLVQISVLPSGAFLVIQAASMNFDDKLLVIITFALLIVLAIVLALRKLK